MIDRATPQLIPMVAILLIGFAFGALGLNADIVWMDEMFSLGNMGAFAPLAGPGDVAAAVAEHSPSHMPLYFILGAAWAELVGWSQVAIRYLSLLFGGLLLASTYRLAADLYNRRIALVAALLLASCALVILFFHEVRMYTLLALLAVWHVWLYWRLERGARLRPLVWLLFVATGSALLYVHVYAAFLFAALGIRHVFAGKLSRRWLSISLGWALCALTFAPYFPAFAAGFFRVTEGTDTAARALSTVALIEHLAYVLVNDVVWLWLPIIVLGAPVMLGRRRGKMSYQLVLLGPTMIALIVAVHAIFPTINLTRFRYFVFVMPFFLMTVAHLLATHERWTATVAVFLIVWAAGGFAIWRQAEDWIYAGRKQLLMDHPPLNLFTDALVGKVKPHDHVLGFADSPMINWRWKHGSSTADYYTDVILGVSGGFVNVRLTGADLRADLEGRIGNNPYLVFVFDPRDPPQEFEQMLQSIEANYERCEALADFARVNARRYVYRPLGCDRGYAPIRYDNGIRIVDKFAFYDSDRAAVQVLTGWEVADEAQLEQYNVSLQILTPDWQNVGGAADRHLHDHILKWYRAELATEALPPGDYRVVVILYDRYSKAKVSGVDETSGEVGAILPVLHFSVPL